MNIIILGDKFQKRMKSKGSVGLLKTNKDYLIVKQYRVIKKYFPNSKIIYIYGFDGKRLTSVLNNEYIDIKQNIEFIYNQEYDNYNYGYSLKLAKNYFQDDILILFGYTQLSDVICKKININKNTSQVFITNNKNNKLGCVIEKNKVENIFYDLENRLEEVYFFTKKDAALIEQILKDKAITTKNMFVFEIINKLIDENIYIKPSIITEVKSKKCRQKL